MDEEKYVENVEYYSKVLQLLTITEVNFIKQSWDFIKTTEGFFDKIFHRVLSEDKGMRSQFAEVEKISDDTFTYSHDVFRVHTNQVVSSLDNMVDNIQHPNIWMLDLLTTATLHRMSKLKLRYFTMFKSFFMDELKIVHGDNFSKEEEEVWDRVMYCIVGIMNQSLEE